MIASSRLLYRALYRLGFTPWDGHGLATGLRNLVEGNGVSSGLSVGTALDIGCGTGDSAIYLARHGWQATGVDFVSTALRQARAKAHAAGVRVDFVHADATRLRWTDVGTDFTLILDNGCLHGMSDDHRGRYVREINAVAAPNARLLIVAFGPGGQFGVRGINQAEIERRFTPAWSPLSVGEESQPASGGSQLVRHYLLQRRN